MTRDDFEEWVNDHLSDAIEELRDIECSPKKWIVMFNDALLTIARREESEDEPETDDIDDDLAMAGADEDEA